MSSVMEAPALEARTQTTVDISSPEEMVHAINCAGALPQALLKGTILEFQDEIILEWLSEQGAKSDKVMRLEGMMIAFNPWNNTRDLQERQCTLCEKMLKPATLYEWVCFVASHPKLAANLLKNMEISVLGPTGVVIFYLDDSGTLSIRLAKTPHQSDRLCMIAGVYLAM